MAKLKSGTRIYGDATIDNKLQVTAGPVLVGTATSTGTTSQPLQVSGGAYFSGIGTGVGIGTTNPSQSLHVQGNVRVTGAFRDSTDLPGTSGQVLQSTVTGTQWATSAAGVSPLYYRLGADYAGSPVNTAQTSLGKSVTVTSSTIYDFEGFFGITRSGSATAAHDFQLLFGGSATIHNTAYALVWYEKSGDTFTANTDKTYTWIVQTASATTLLNIGLAGGTDSFRIYMKGTVNINAGGTFAPQYKMSVASNAYTTVLGSYFKMTPLTISSGSGASAIASSGTWA